MTDLTVPLAERAQYASTDWIETARRYLASRVDASPPFSFSMTLDNVPPHLNAESSTPYGYTVRVGDGAAAVEDRPDGGAQLRVRADYNAALPFAWTNNADAESSDLRPPRVRGPFGSTRRRGRTARRPGGPCTAVGLPRPHGAAHGEQPGCPASGAAPWPREQPGRPGRQGLHGAARRVHARIGRRVARRGPSQPRRRTAGHGASARRCCCAADASGNTRRRIRGC